MTRLGLPVAGINPLRRVRYPASRRGARVSQYIVAGINPLRRVRYSRGRAWSRAARAGRRHQPPAQGSLLRAARGTRRVGKRRRHQPPAQGSLRSCGGRSSSPSARSQASTPCAGFATQMSRAHYEAEPPSRRHQPPAQGSLRSVLPIVLRSVASGRRHQPPAQGSLQREAERRTIWRDRVAGINPLRRVRYGC